MEKVPSFYVGAQAVDMLEDLNNLITWSHNHATICSHKPWREGALLTEVSHLCVVAWKCNAGHAYHWPITLASDVPVEEEESRENRSKKNGRKRKQPLNEEEENMTQMDRRAEDTSTHSHCSLMTHLSDERGDRSVIMSTKDTSVTRVKMNLQKTMTQQCLPTRIDHGETNMFIKKADRVSVELNKKSSNVAEEKCPERNKVYEETHSGISDFFTTAVEDAPAQVRTLSNAERKECLTPKGEQNSTNSPTSKLFNQGQGESQSQDSSSSPSLSIPQKPGPASNPSYENGSLMTAPRKAAKKEVPKKADVQMGQLKILDTWVASQNPGSLPIAELDKQLSIYFRCIGEESERQDLTHSTLMSYVRTLDRRLQSQGCGFSLLKSPAFPNASKELNTCCQYIRQKESEGDMEVIQSLRPEEEAFLRQSGVISRSTPEGLLSLVLMNNLRAFGKLHLDGVWPIRISDFQLVTETHPMTYNCDKVEYLQWTPPNSSDHAPVRMHGRRDDLERCPLQDYKLYVTKRTGGFVTFQDPFYCNYRKCQPWEDNWYSRIALTKPRLEKIIKILSHHILTIRNSRAVAI